MDTTSRQALPAALVRVVMICFIGCTAMFAPPIVLQAASFHGVAFSVLYLLLSAYDRNNVDYLIGVKRFLSSLNGFSTGLPACIGAYLFIYYEEVWWAQLAAGLELGYYCADMLFVSDKQREISVVSVNQFIAVIGLLLHMYFGLYGPLAIGLLQEITNPSTMLLKLLPNASWALRWRPMLKTAGTYVFIIPRFCVAVPQYAWCIYLYHEQLLGLMMLLYWSSFTLSNFLKMSQLIRTA